MKKLESIATIAVFGLLTLSLGIATFLIKDEEYSVYERRQLAQKPEYDAEAPLSDYISGWEDYLIDQFALRDEFRFVKSIFARTFLQSSDVNGYIVKDGSEAELLYPTNDARIELNLQTIEKVRSTLFADANAYFAVIPDKSVYLDAPLGLDYAFIGDSAAEMLQAEQIDLTDTLTADDFYRTDIHWKQENLKAVYEKIRETVNPDLPEWESLDMELKCAGDFYGVLYGQAAYPISPDQLNYLTGDWLDGCTLSVVDTGGKAEIYQPDKLSEDDPYDLFMGGEYAITVLENPNLQNGRELVLIRDSFGRSIAPLLAAGYEKITLIDLRWVRADYLGVVWEALPSDGDSPRTRDLLVLLSGQVINSVLY